MVMTTVQGWWWPWLVFGFKYVFTVCFVFFFAINVWTCFYFIPWRQIVKILENESKPVPGEELLPALTSADRLAFLIIIIIIIIIMIIILINTVLDYPLPLWGFSAVMKQIVVMEHNTAKNPNWWRRTSGLFYKHSWGFKLRTTKEEIQPLVGAGLKGSTTHTAPFRFPNQSVYKWMYFLKSIILKTRSTT